MASNAVENSKVKRSLVAAFTTDGTGRRFLVQVDSAEELAEKLAERDTWAFWLVTYGEQRYIEQTAGGLFMAREIAEGDYWKTATFARFISEATW